MARIGIGDFCIVRLDSFPPFLEVIIDIVKQVLASQCVFRLIG